MALRSAANVTIKRVRLLVAIFFALVVLVPMAVLNACAADPIRLAMITAKTGVAGKSNAVSFDAARFAVDEINANGGILGRDVVLLEYDNLSTPEGSAAAARQAIEDGAVAVVGCNWSSHSLAMAKVLQDAQIPMVSHMSTNPAVTRVGNFIFRICFSDSFQGLGLARFSRMRLKDKTAVVLTDEGRTYSKGLSSSFINAFEQLGGKVLWQGIYVRDNIAYDEILDTVERLSPDVLFVPGGYADVSGFFGRAKDRKASWHLISADGVSIHLYDRLGSKAHGIYFSGHWDRWVDTDASRRFVREYEKGGKTANEDALALTYDSFMVIKEAIERARSTDGDNVRQALAMTSGYEGVTGVIRFDINGDPIKSLVINEFKFGGIMFLEQIYP